MERAQKRCLVFTVSNEAKSCRYQWKMKTVNRVYWIAVICTDQVNPLYSNIVGSIHCLRSRIPLSFYSHGEINKKKTFFVDGKRKRPNAACIVFPDAFIEKTV